MSGVAGLYNVPSTPEEWGTWAFVHAAHHRDINRVLYQDTGETLPEFILDPLNPKDVSVWLYQHQLMHDSQNAILGIDGSDLLDVDFTNQSELAGWIWLNSVEHFQAANTLGIG